jgi:tetratricopeptide (TPR) repeat protein
MLLVLATAWWIWLWLQVDRSILVRVPILDEAFYLREGAAIAQGRLLPGQPFIMSPLYPYLVAATGSGRTLDQRNVRTGSPPVGIRVLQAVAWCGIIWLLWRSGRRLLPRWAVPLPPLLFALYRPAAIFATTTLLEIPLAFLVTFLLSLLASGREIVPGRGIVHSTRRAVLAGGLLGLASLLRAHTIMLAVPTALVLGLGPGGRRRLLICGAVVLALVMPVVLYNNITGGRLTGISCNGGLNLYIGNSAQADGFFISFAGFDFEEDPAGVAFLSARLGEQVEGVTEADHLWAMAAWERMVYHPFRAARLYLKKIWLHFVGWEISQVTPLEAWPRESPLLRLLPVPYALIAAAGLAGLWLSSWWRSQYLWPWVMGLAVLVAVQSLFFVVTRYRMVLVPGLCLLGTSSLVFLTQRRPGRWVSSVVAIALAVVATVPWGLGPVRAHWRSLSLCNEAVRWEWLGGPEGMARAEELYFEALNHDATQMVAYRNLARVLVQQDQAERAETILKLGSLKVPRPQLVQQDLISLLLQQGRLQDVLPRLAAYVSDYPNDADMLHNYAILLARIGRGEAAMDAARELIRLEPEDPRGYIDLGVLLARAGRAAEARDVFSAGLQRNPDNEDLRHNLEQLPQGSP